MVYRNVLRLCKEKGISVARLEKECGLGNATVRGWAKCSPRAENLKRVADFFGCSVDDLFKEDT